MLRMMSMGTITATAIRTTPPTTAPAITGILPPPPLLPLLLLPEELLDDDVPAEPPPDVAVGALGPMTGLLTLTPAYPALLSEALIAAMVAELLKPATTVAASVVVLMAV